jgi:integrase
MFNLPHGCYTSGDGPAVHPKNWQNKNASIKHYWYISYRFYDPSIPGKKLVIVKGGINEYKTLESRQLAAKTILDTEIEMLLQGYNPIKKIILPVEKKTPGEIDPSTPLIEALRYALAKKDCEKQTRIDIGSVIKYFEKSAIELGKAKLPVKDIRRKDIRMILDNCKNVFVITNGKPSKKKIWNNNQFNHYRKYIGALYSELEELEIVEYNPVEKIAKKETIKKIRETLTDEQRKRISDHLAEHYPAFLRYINIFFHSGSRRSELFNVRGCDVDLAGQRFKTIVKKGKSKREVWKTIKDIALPLWVELVSGCSPDDFIFSLDLVPGKRCILPEYVTRRWKKIVKNKLGITADLYSLKHLHTTEIKDYLDDEQGTKEIAEHNSHTSSAMVVTIYDVKNEQRRHNKVKGINNSFA